MPSKEENIETVRTLLAGLSERELRAFGVAALQRWRLRSPSERSFAMNGLGLHLTEILADAKGINCDSNACKEVFLSHLTEDWLAPVLEFVWWMVRAGLAIPRISQYYPYPPGYDLTSAGARFLDSAEDHPLAPGFLDRLRSRCPDIPDGAFALLFDANACLEAGLVRPAVTIMGVAYELVVEHSLLASGYDEDAIRKMKAWERIDLLRKAISKSGLKKEEKSAALLACAFADNLRARRNDASHTKPRFPFDSADEGEELIISACRHLVDFALLLSSREA